MQAIMIWQMDLSWCASKKKKHIPILYPLWYLIILNIGLRLYTKLTFKNQKWFCVLKFCCWFKTFCEHEQCKLSNKSPACFTSNYHEFNREIEDWPSYPLRLLGISHFEPSLIYSYYIWIIQSLSTKRTLWISLSLFLLRL